MIFTAVSRALGQIGDPRFTRVLAMGIGLTLGLLIAVYVVVGRLVAWLVPDSLTLPFVGQITWLDNLASGFSVVALMILSVFLMVPVASMFTSIFLDDVADAVEDEHYGHLAPAPRLGFLAGLGQNLSFLGVLIIANLLALILYLLFLPLGPFIFVALNGYLLGREYYQLIAVRRLGAEGARVARRRHAIVIWATGILMALPLAVPLVNLVVPVLGVAAFTHLFHLTEGASSQTSRDRAR